MKESGTELTVSQNEVFKSRDSKIWVLIFHSCGNKLLITKKKVQKRVVIEDENIFHCLFK